MAKVPHERIEAAFGSYNQREGSASAISLSADGSKMVYSYQTLMRPVEIFQMKPDGSDARQTTDFGAMSWAPYEHPSGRYIVFSSNKLGFENFELFIVDAEGTKPLPLLGWDVRGAIREIADAADARLDGEVGPQIARDRLRLGRRFNDDEVGAHVTTLAVEC